MCHLRVCGVHLAGRRGRAITLYTSGVRYCKNQLNTGWISLILIPILILFTVTNHSRARGRAKCAAGCESSTVCLHRHVYFLLKWECRGEKLEKKYLEGCYKQQLFFDVSVYAKVGWLYIYIYTHPELQTFGTYTPVFGLFCVCFGFPRWHGSNLGKCWIEFLLFVSQVCPPSSLQTWHYANFQKDKFCFVGLAHLTCGD